MEFKNEKKSLERVVVGGNLGDAAVDAMQQAGIQENAIPEDAVIINQSLLPSKGRFYDKAKMYITPLTPKNLKNLNTMTEETANATLNAILAERIGGIDHRKILQGDKIWLIFYLRSITYDDYPLFVKYTCPDCKCTHTAKICLNDIAVKYINDEFDFKLKLPKSGKMLTLRYPTIGDEIKAEAKKHDNTSIFETVDPELIDVAAYIDEIDGERQTLWTAYQFILKMQAKDFATFTNFMINNNIGLVPTVNIECACGYTVKKKIGFTPDFFTPNFVQEQA